MQMKCPSSACSMEPATRAGAAGPPSPRSRSHWGVVRSKPKRSFDLTDDIIRIARHQAKLGAIHQEIQVFQYDSADQGTVAFWFDNGIEYAIAALEEDAGFLHFRTQPAPAFGIANSDFRFIRLERILFDVTQGS